MKVANYARVANSTFYRRNLSSVHRKQMLMMSNASRRVPLLMRALSAVLLLFWVSAANAQTAHYSGTQITLANSVAPGGVTVDNGGNIYFSDPANNRVMELPWTSSGYGAQTAVGASLSLSTPQGVAVDSSGNVYIADTGNGRVLKIPPSDLSCAKSSDCTSIGTGLTSPVAVATDGTGNVFIADSNLTSVLKVPATDATCATPGDCTNVGANLLRAHGVSVDMSGNVYIADTGNGRVVRVPPNDPTCATSIDCTTVGTGLASPESVAVDGSGNVYIADSSLTSLLRVSGTDLTCVNAGDCTAVGSGLSSPNGVALDRNGNVEICNSGGPSLLQLQLTAVDFGGSKVGTASAMLTVPFVFDSGGSLNSTTPYQVRTLGATGLDFANVGGTCSGTGTYAQGDSCTVEITFTPMFPGVRYGAILLEDSSGNVIATAYLHGTGVGPQVALMPGTISTFAGNGTQGFSNNVLATSAQFNTPVGVAVDGAGNLYIANIYDSVVQLVLKSTGIVSTVAGGGGAPGQDNGYSGDGGPGTGAQLYYPSSLALDGAGNLFIADSANNVIRKLAAVSGIITTVAGNGTAGYSGDGGPATSAKLNNPYGVVVDGAGNLYIADKNNDVVRKVSASTGIISTVAGNGTAGYTGDGGSATSAMLSNVYSVALDSAGDLYIADYSNDVIRKVDASTGLISTVAGNGTFGFSGDGGPATSAELNSVEGVAVDSAGDIYIADLFNNRIRMVSEATGLINTIAGNGTKGYIGDGGPATSAELSYPSGVFVDGNGNVYIGDAGNFVVREVNVKSAGITFLTATGVGTTDTTDGPQSIAVSNIGNSPLTLPAPTTGTNPTISTAAGFTQDSSETCPSLSATSSAATLASGSYCTYVVDFAPAVVGTNSGSLVLSDNDLNVISSTQSIALSGVGVLISETLSVTNSPVIYNGSPQAALVSASVSGTVSNVKYSGSSTVPTSAGTYAITADFTPTDTTTYASLTGASAGNFVISKATPTISVTPSVASIGVSMSLNITVQVTGSGAMPTGTVILSGGGYTSPVATLVGGTYTFTIPANSLNIGTDALTASYSGEANYVAATGTNSVTVAMSTFTMSATAASVSPGGSATSAVTITSSNGYAGTVKLACAVTSGPTGATDPPICTASQTVTLNASTTSGAASVTISTTAASTAALARPTVPGGKGWGGAGGSAALAVLIFWGILPKRRRWQSMLGVLVSMIVLGGLVACGGAGSIGSGTTTPTNPGTTPGNYTITVTGTGNDPATTTATTTFILTVK